MCNEADKWHWQEPGTAWKGIGIYHVTMVVPSREPLLGTLVIPENDPAQARVDATELGKKMIGIMFKIPDFHPEVRVLQYCLMPDHLHTILYVTRQMPKGIGTVVRGFWQGAKKIGRQYFSSIHPNNIRGNGRNIDDNPNNIRDNKRNIDDNPNNIRGNERNSDDNPNDIRGSGRKSEVNPIFTEKPFIRTMSCRGQLQAMIRYVQLNPQRLAAKRLNPDLFRMHRQTEISGLMFTSLGNHFLLNWPDRQFVEMSRSSTDEEIKRKLQYVLTAAQNGAVTYTAAISKGEQVVARTLREQGMPLVILLSDGFPDDGSPHEKYYKPGGLYFEACSKGHLLLLEPTVQTITSPVIHSAAEKTLRQKAEEKHIAYKPLSASTQRYRFVALNEIGKFIIENLE